MTFRIQYVSTKVVEVETYGNNDYPNYNIVVYRCVHSLVVFKVVHHFIKHYKEHAHFFTTESISKHSNFQTTNEICWVYSIYFIIFLHFWKNFFLPSKRG